MPRSLARSASTLALAAAALLAALPGAGLAAGTRTEKGMTLVVPDADAALGRVYYVLPGKDAQVTFTSDAPLEHIKGTSNRVVGYAVAAPDRAAPMLKGVFHLPINTIDTGIPMRDEHLQSAQWMDAGAYPDIVFTVSAVKNQTETRSGDGFTTYAATLVGDMTIKGVTKPMEIPARITVMPETDKTKARAPGDLMAVRAQYAVKLSDFGVAKGNPAMNSGKVADDITLDTFLLLSTVSPEAGR